MNYNNPLATIRAATELTVNPLHREKPRLTSALTKRRYLVEMSSREFHDYNSLLLLEFVIILPSFPFTINVRNVKILRGFCGRKIPFLRCATYTTQDGYLYEHKSQCPTGQDLQIVSTHPETDFQ